MNRTLILLLVVVWILVPSLSFGADWPQFRGKDRLGVWNERLPTHLPEGGPRALWKLTIGEGYAGPAVVGTRLFILDRLPVGPTNATEVERVLSVDAGSGKMLWSHSYPVQVKYRGGYENGPRSTPTVSDGKVYTLGGMGHFHCLDAKSGKVLWSHDLVKSENTLIADWGMVSAPLVDGDRVVIQAGARPEGTIMAFHKTTGAPLWRSLTNKAGYASIVRVTPPGSSAQYIAWTSDLIAGLDPATGKVGWSHPRKLAWDQAVTTPIYDPATSTLLFPSDREGMLALRYTRGSPTPAQVWDRRTFSSLHSTEVVINSHLYGFNHDGNIKNECGELRCVDLKTGDLVWKQAGLTRTGNWAHAHITYNQGNGIAYITNEMGELILGRISSQGFVEVARESVVGKTWSYPAYSNGVMYHRNETTLVALTLK